MRADAERCPERCIVAVDEAEQVVRAGVDVSQVGGNPLPEVALKADLRGPGPRQLQVAVGDVDIGQERGCLGGIELAVDGGNRTEP